MKSDMVFESHSRGISALQGRAISYLLVIALGLTIVMALISSTTYRVHPDELDHIGAGRFFVDNWLPPPVADPRTLDSYSYAGFSYLNEWDIVYLLAGKFARLASPVVANEVYAFRFFNVFLFLCLTCLAWLRRDEILMFSVLLLSPQIWLLFSYFNADAFPIFLSFLVGYELTSARSAYSDRTRPPFSRYLRLGILVGLIILSKKTFWMFAVFTFGYVALVEFLHLADRDWRALCLRAGMLVAIVCAVTLPRIGYDIRVNGWPSQKTAEIIATAERLADDGYKPSQYDSTHEASGGAKLKKKGIGFLELALATKSYYERTWFPQSVMTGFGTYYYMFIYGPKWLYALAAGCVGLLAAVLSFSILRKGSAFEKTTLLLSLLCCVGILGLSLYHSWVNDYQPQGRYLFAAFPILGILLVKSKELLNSRLTMGLISAGFLLSSYSFVLVGLSHIPKVWENAEVPQNPVLKLGREWQQQP